MTRDYVWSSEDVVLAIEALDWYARSFRGEGAVRTRKLMHIIEAGLETVTRDPRS